MAESTLILGYDDFAAEVAQEIGWSRDSTEWDTDQTSIIDAIVQAGVRQVYTPPILPGERDAYFWRFLKPVDTITVWPTTTGAVLGFPLYYGSIDQSLITATAAAFYPSMVGKSFTFDTSGTSYTITGYTSSMVIAVSGDATGETSGDTFTITADGDYRLPDDFGGIEGNLMFAPTKGWHSIIITNGERIRSKRQINSSTGRPQMAAVVPLTSDGSAGQRFDMAFHPTPSAVYVLSYRKIALQNKLSTTYPYPLGGSQHAELFKASCIAAAESKYRRGEQVRRGEFIDRLRTSVTQDRMANAADFLGQDGGGSCDADMSGTYRVYHEKQTT